MCMLTYKVKHSMKSDTDTLVMTISYTSKSCVGLCVAMHGIYSVQYSYNKEHVTGSSKHSLFPSLWFSVSQTTCIMPFCL